MAIQEPQAPVKAKAVVKTVRRKRSAQSAKVADSNITTFSSDLLTPEEERELLTSFWDVKSELVRVLVRHFPAELRAVRPPLEPWPMAQFIREHCTNERSTVIAIRTSNTCRIRCAQSRVIPWYSFGGGTGGLALCVHHKSRQLTTFPVAWLVDHSTKRRLGDSILGFRMPHAKARRREEGKGAGGPSSSRLRVSRSVQPAG